MTFVSYAQNFEDVVLWRALHDVERGRYLDIGAQDPVVDSVSLAFYNAGWRGIHVEPTPDYASRLRSARPDETVIEAAVADAAGPIDFYEIPLTGLSTGRKRIADGHKNAGYAFNRLAVPTVRLESLLEMAEGDIHWLKIDVEGMEADVLRSWGDSPARPWILVIEATEPGTQVRTHEDWIAQVTGRGYQEAQFDGLSRYFVHEAHVDLVARLAQPANVFDAFAVSRDHFSAGALTRDFDSLALQLEDVEHRAEELSVQLSNIREARDDAVKQHRDTLLQLWSAEQTYRTDIEAQKARVEQLHNQLLDQAQESARRLLQAEQDRRVAAETLWREFQSNERQLRDESREREARLQNQIRAIESSLGAARAELSQSEKRTERLRLELDQANEAAAEAGEISTRYQREATEIRASLEVVRAAAAASEEQLRAAAAASEEQLRAAAAASEEQLRALAAASEEQLRALSNELEQVRSSRAQAYALLDAAASDRPDWWQRLGYSLRLSRPRSAALALDAWQSGLNEPPPQLEASPKATNGMAYILNNAEPEQLNPYLRADSLAELLSWDDADFVRCAYVTVLGRQPDPSGESYYTSRIRRGHSKMEVLWQLRKSPEGPFHDPGIAGFDRALRRARLARMPFAGFFIRAFNGEEGNRVADRRHRRVLNELGRLQRAVADRVNWTAERAESMREEPSSPPATQDSGPKNNVQSADTEFLRLNPRARSIYRQLATAEPG